MRVPLSWLRDFVDVELTPEQLAERLTLLGMEVKHIERWGADWENVVVGELLTVERHPRADRLSLTTVTLGDGGEPLSIVCGATNIAPGQRIPVALPGAVLPGNRRIERTEKMGVVSNGMLCSGDELRLTGDGDGILILPADTPLGVPLVDLYGDVVLDVDVKPNRGDALSILGLAREVAAATGAAGPHARDHGGGGEWPVHRRAPGRRGPRPGPVHGLRRPLGERRDRRPVAGRRPDAAPRRRPAPDQQRRRRLQLRHARAGQADPHLRRRGGPRGRRRPGHDRRPPRDAGRAPRDARPRRARARAATRCSSPTRQAPSPSPASWAAPAPRCRTRPRDVVIESAIFDPGQHPPHGPAARAPLRGVRAASRRARSRAWPASARTARRS